MKKIITPLSLLLILMIICLCPAGKITSDKSVSENRIMFHYEIVGCGSLVRKVIDGGEAVSAKFKGEYPDIGENEVVFTEDSDEPQRIFDSADFQTGGLAQKYTYIAEGEAVGVAEGADDCCEPMPVYNENVVLFRIDNWYFTEYVPRISIASPLFLLLILVIALLLVVWAGIAMHLAIVCRRRKNSLMAGV